MKGVDCTSVRTINVYSKLCNDCVHASIVQDHNTQIIEIPRKTVLLFEYYMCTVDTPEASLSTAIRGDAWVAILSLFSYCFPRK